MKSKNVLFFSVCAFVISFCAAYIALRYFEVPLPKYYPTLRLWSAAKQGKAPGMGWYALFGASLSAAAVSGCASYAVLRGTLRDVARCQTPVRLFSWLTIAAALLMVFYNAHHEYLSWFLKKR